MNEELILKYVLQNAVRYNGKANAGAVIGKVLQEDPELKNDINRVKGYIELIVKDVNSMTLKNQEDKLKLLAPELLEVKHEKEVRKIPELKNAKKVVMRFAPNPNGPLSLGHCRQALWNWFFVENYKGSYVLRFDDTDPKVKTPLKDAYEWFKDDLKWLNVKVSKTVIQSSRLKIYYNYAEELLKQGNAYVCNCNQDLFKKLINMREP